MAVPYLDFLGESGPNPPKAPPAVVKPPKMTAAMVARDRENAAKRKAAEDRRREEQRQVNNSRVALQKARDAKMQADYHKQMMADPGPAGQAYRARYKRQHSAGVDWGLIPMGAKVIGTGAAIIATGGAVAGAVGVSAAVGTATAAGAVSKAADAIDTGTKLARAAKNRDVLGAASAAAKGGDMINLDVGVKVPKVKVPKLPKEAKKVTSVAKALPKSVASTATKAGKKAAAAAVTPAKAKKPAKSAGKLPMGLGSIAGKVTGSVAALGGLGAASLPYGRSTGTPVAAGLQAAALAKVKPFATAIASGRVKRPAPAASSPSSPKGSTSKPPQLSDAAAPKVSSWVIPREGPNKGRIMLQAV